MNENEKKLAAAARNAYARKWRAENPEKVRAINENYWLRKAKKEAAVLKDSNDEKEFSNGTK